MISAAPRIPTFLEGFNNTGSTIAPYLAVMGGPAAIALPSAVSSPVYGITTESIADQARGDVQIGGVAIGTAGEAISAADVAAGCRLYPATTGKLFKWAPASGVNQSIVGVPLSPATGDGDTFDVLLGAGGIGQGA